jgi:hypothetical protein
MLLSADGSHFPENKLPHLGYPLLSLFRPASFSSPCSAHPSTLPCCYPFNMPHTPLSQELLFLLHRESQMSTWLVLLFLLIQFLPCTGCVTIGREFHFKAFISLNIAGREARSLDTVGLQGPL